MDVVSNFEAESPTKKQKLLSTAAAGGGSDSPPSNRAVGLTPAPNAKGDMYKILDIVNNEQANYIEYM